MFEICKQHNIPIVMLTSGGYLPKTARIIADSIMNLHKKGLISGNTRLKGHWVLPHYQFTLKIGKLWVLPLVIIRSQYFLNQVPRFVPYHGEADGWCFSINGMFYLFRYLLCYYRILYFASALIFSNKIQFFF